VAVKAEFSSLFVVREIVFFGRIIVFLYNVTNPAFIGGYRPMQILRLSHGLVTFRGHTAFLCRDKAGQREGKSKTNTEQFENFSF
jgi:hypothetical protein